MTVPTPMRSPADCLQIRDLHLLAEFCVLKEGGIAETSDLSAMTAFCAQGDRDRVKILPPFFVGKITWIGREIPTRDGTGIVSSCLAEFNSECRGWHYGWTGSRFKTSINHVLAVHILLPSRRRGQPQSVGLRLAATFYSPSFMVVSLRRKGQNLLPEGENEGSIRRSNTMHLNPYRHHRRVRGRRDSPVSADGSHELRLIADLFDEVLSSTLGFSYVSPHGRGKRDYVYL